MLPRSLGHRAPLLWLALPYAAGLVAGRCGVNLPVAWALGVALAGAVVAACAAWRSEKRWPWALSLSAALLLAGDASYQLHRRRLPEWDALPAREARVSLRIDRVFAQGNAHRVTGLATVTQTEAHLRELVGQSVYFGLNLRTGQAAPVRSAQLAAVGVLQAVPENPPAATFERYLADAGVNFRLTRGRMLAEERAPAAYYRFCAAAAERFEAILGAGIAEKRPALAGVLRAMLLGQTHEMSDEQNRLFMRSGTMHLFAISGLHISVIAVALYAGLGVLRLPRWPRFLASTAILWLYVDITGAAPSAVRAFVMVALVETALLVRRPVNPLATLAAATAAVLVFAPLQFFTASFQMSYGIVAALLLFGLPLSEAWQERWRPFAWLPAATWRWWHRGADLAWSWLTAAVALGLGASLVSLITGVQFFRLFTPGAFFANLVLIPASSLVILGGFGSLVAGLCGLTSLASLLNHGSAVVLWLIEAGVRQFVDGMPGVFFAAEFRAPWIGGAVHAAVLAACLAGYAGKWEAKRGGWWPPCALVALALLFGVKWG
ncbi:MAG: ComEC/Rec2 family competence protein [Opitutae bacterium]|nr:ComEC/Rec2 family competence protein [Opitutae bacterium]